jgi:coenzyme F420-reducing hydrogenase alpha subunit
MLERGATLSSFQYHYARLIEMLYCVEKIDQLLNGPEILSDHVRAQGRPEPHGRHRRQRSAARHAAAPLQDRPQMA